MPKNTTDKHRAAYIPFRCDADTYETICKIADSKRLAKVDVLRSLVFDGMAKQGYKPEEDQAYTLVRAAVQEVMKPYVERLAAISAKATQLSGADFFLMVYLGTLLLPESGRQQLEEAAARARKLGIEYLKLSKDTDIDAFIASGIMKIND